MEEQNIRCDWCTRKVRYFEVERALTFQMGAGEPNLFCCAECWEEYRKSLKRTTQVPAKTERG